MNWVSLHCTIDVSHTQWLDVLKLLLDSKSRIPISDFSGYYCSKTNNFLSVLKLPCFVRHTVKAKHVFVIFVKDIAEPD